MKSFGGYLELELPKLKEYHPDAIKLNTGRNAFEYLLRLRNLKKIYLPFFTCDVILQPINRLNLNYEFYEIDNKLEPKFDYSKLTHNDVFLYVNYFGLKDKFISQISHISPYLIIDNCQSFFSKPIEGVDTFYSPRKFFGVTDGAYLYSDKKLNVEFDTDLSFKRFEHLIKRIDLGAEEGYLDYIHSEKLLDNRCISNMSNLTNKVLKSIDYDTINRKRIDNFNFLVKEFEFLNLLKIKKVSKATLCYPLLLENSVEKHRIKLNNLNIYTPIYWKKVLEFLPDRSYFEAELVENTLYIPIDQRYNISDMKYIVKVLKDIIKKDE